MSWVRGLKCPISRKYSMEWALAAKGYSTTGEVPQRRSSVAFNSIFFGVRCYKWKQHTAWPFPELLTTFPITRMEAESPTAWLATCSQPGQSLEMTIWSSVMTEPSLSLMKAKVPRPCSLNRWVQYGSAHPPDSLYPATHTNGVIYVRHTLVLTKKDLKGCTVLVAYCALVFSQLFLLWCELRFQLFELFFQLTQSVWHLSKHTWSLSAVICSTVCDILRNVESGDF